TRVYIDQGSCPDLDGLQVATAERIVAGRPAHAGDRAPLWEWSELRVRQLHKDSSSYAGMHTDDGASPNHEKLTRNCDRSIISWLSCSDSPHGYSSPLSYASSAPARGASRAANLTGL